MIYLIDNYDSFTYNLYHVFVSYGVAVEVIRNDACSAADIEAKKPKAIVISPGPCRPEQTGICLELIGLLHKNPLPVLGVCLGHQTIGQYFGATVTYAPNIMHGKVSTIEHTQHRMFAGIARRFHAARYHSLTLATSHIPSCLEITAYSNDDRQIMAFQHCELPFWGVQFHPESIATPDGPLLIENFLRQNKILN